MTDVIDEKTYDIWKVGDKFLIGDDDDSSKKLTVVGILGNKLLGSDGNKYSRYGVTKFSESVEPEMFSFIKDNCNESKMFRNNYLTALTLRDTVDAAFLNMVTLYMLAQEFETAPFAQNYASRTMVYGNFSQSRVSSTDLYQALHISIYRDTKEGDRLKAPEQNASLRVRLHMNEKYVKDFLRGIGSGRLDRITATRLLYKLESQMNIQVSNYKSLRRLITDWEHLTTFQKQTCVTRLLQYYRTRGRRSDLFGTLSTFVQHKSWEQKTKDNAEVKAIGPANAIHGTSSSDNFISSIAKVGGAGFIGYAAAKALGKLR
jgi:hypothetical protein